MNDLNYSELLAIFMAIYICILWCIHRIKNAEFYIQRRRFPIFAVRDTFVRMHIEGALPDETFYRLISLCNDALLLTERIDLRHYFDAIDKTSTQVRRSPFSEEIILLSKKNHEFRELIIKLMRHIVILMIQNSFFNVFAILKYYLKRKSMIKTTLTHAKEIRNFERRLCRV